VLGFQDIDKTKLMVVGGNATQLIKDGQRVRMHRTEGYKTAYDINVIFLSHVDILIYFFQDTLQPFCRLKRI